MSAFKPLPIPPHIAASEKKIPDSKTLFYGQISNMIAYGFQSAKGEPLAVLFPIKDGQPLAVSRDTLLTLAKMMEGPSNSITP